MPVVPCSNEHIRQNSAVKTFSGEIRGNLISDAPPFARLWTNRPPMQSITQSSSADHVAFTMTLAM